MSQVSEQLLVQKDNAGLRLNLELLLLLLERKELFLLHLHLLVLFFFPQLQPGCLLLPRSELLLSQLQILLELPALGFLLADRLLLLVEFE